MDEFEVKLNNVPGKLEDSTLGIWAAGNHINVLEMVHFFFCLQPSTFFCFHRECIQQLPRVWSDLQTPTMAGNFQCCTHHETNVAVRHEGDTRVLTSTNCKIIVYQLCSPRMFSSSAPGVPVGSRQQQWPWRQEPASPRSSSG